MAGAFSMLIFFDDLYYSLIASGLVGIATAFNHGTMAPWLSLPTELFDVAVASTVIEVSTTSLMFGR